MTGLGRGHSLLYYEHISVLVSLCLWTVSFTSVFLPHPRWDRRVQVDWKWIFPFSCVNGLELTVVVYFSSSKWIQFSSVQSLIGVRLFENPWTVARQASLSITNSQRYANSCPLSRWCHPTISSSVIPFPPAFNLSQHQGLYKWVSSLNQVANILEFQLQHQSFQWIIRTDFL